MKFYFNWNNVKNKYLSDYVVWPKLHLHLVKSVAMLTKELMHCIFCCSFWLNKMCVFGLHNFKQRTYGKQNIAKMRFNKYCFQRHYSQGQSSICKEIHVRFMQHLRLCTNSSFEKYICIVYFFFFSFKFCVEMWVRA